MTHRLGRFQIPVTDFYLYQVDDRAFPDISEPPWQLLYNDFGNNPLTGISRSSRPNSQRSESMEKSQTWYIVKGKSGTCTILSKDQVEAQANSDILDRWGPFESSHEAISRRIGLIRAGKCQPI